MNTEQAHDESREDLQERLDRLYQEKAAAEETLDAHERKLAGLKRDVKDLLRQVEELNKEAAMQEDIR